MGKITLDGEQEKKKIHLGRTAVSSKEIDGYKNLLDIQ